MPILRLATAIENARSEDEENVLALLDHLVPTLADWRQGEHLRAEQARLEPLVEPLQAHIQEKAQQVDTLKASVQTLEAEAKRQKNLSNIIFGAAVVLAAVLWYLAGTTVAAVALVVGLGGGVWQRKNAAKAAEQLSAAQAELLGAESELANLHSERREIEERLASIDEELDARSDGFPKVALARVGFPLTVQEVAGTNVLMDRSGSHPSVSLQAVDFSEISDDVREIGTKVQAMSTIPPLLSPGDKPIEDPMTQLYGEESELQDLVTEFTVTLGKLDEVAMGLPLVPASSALVERLRDGQLAPASPATSLQIDVGDSPDAVERFLKAVESGDISGVNVPRMVEEVYTALNNTCNRFAQARVSSMNTIHAGLTQVLSRANWVGQKFLCPRSIQAPKYVQDILGVQIKEAHNMGLHDLMDRLQGDEVIRKRIAKKPDLLDQLENCYHAIRDYAPTTMSDEGVEVQAASRPRHMDQQHDEAIKQFRLTLTQVITGASRPTLNLTPEAQLFYDPDSGEWTSDLTPYVYLTPDVIKYGAMTKVMHGLMLPLWEHLWTEKADFRKSELFRTNESMIQMSEKEAEKLIEIGNQFRGDMRSNRQNLYLIESELNSKYEEIVAFRDGMQRLNLVSERVMQQLTDEKLKKLVVNQSPLEMGSRYETNLSLMPRMQTEMRGTVPDPIDMLREPHLLLEPPQQDGNRLLAQ
jgi:hypothetical protein